MLGLVAGTRGKGEVLEQAGVGETYAYTVIYLRKSIMNQNSKTTANSNNITTPLLSVLNGVVRPS